MFQFACKIKPFAAFIPSCRALFEAYAVNVSTPGTAVPV